MIGHCNLTTFPLQIDALLQVMTTTMVAIL